MKLEEFEIFFEKICHFDKTLGLKAIYKDYGDIEYHLLVEEKHLSSPQTCHGGVIAAMMDAVLGLTTLSFSIKDNLLCSTIEFKLNFLAPVFQGDLLIGKGNIHFKGKKIVHTSGIISKNDFSLEENKRAIGMGTFNLYPMDKKIIV